MYQVIDTRTKGIKGRWASSDDAHKQARALNRAYGAFRYRTRPVRTPV